MQARFVIVNLCEAVTLAPLVQENRFTGISAADLGVIKNAWIAIEAGKILAVGNGAVSDVYSAWPTVDGKRSLAIPGLIDAHTHPVYAGSRADEFALRLEGKTYQDIAAAGGGIHSTVKATAAASDEKLEQLLEQRFQTFLHHGVTSLEAKSGYGLSVFEELRHLRILKKIANRSLLSVSRTCLALHAVPKTAVSARAWSETCAKELLPVVAREGLADAVDVFIEQGYFSVEDAKPFLDAAKSLSLKIRIHADEFSDVGAAACAAEYKALSADHLQFASKEGIQKMAKAGVTALLLPGTSLYTSIPYTEATLYRTLGCPVALATDFNPGSCPVDNLRLIVTIGAIHCKLTTAEALAAVTWVAAKSLGLEAVKGALVEGKDADLVLLPLSSVAEFVADLGRAKPFAVFARGKSVL